ncbi:MAG TPA: thiamine phosphate synthase [Actinomycetota bacterium]|nr:thiamine phosphate synthase [Actinomycetota bacterium]
MKPSERRDRLDRARLYLVSGADHEDLSGFLDAVLEAGVDAVQIREKDAEAGDVIRRGEVFREMAERHGALFIVNDRPDIALALDADGVHLGQNDLPVEVARGILGPDAIIGLSTHSRDQLDAAPTEADYVCVGPIWETPTKAGRPAVGVDLVRYAAEHERRPWFAIGGINTDNLPQVVAAGARRIVVVRAVTKAPDPRSAVRALLESVQWKP